IAACRRRNPSHQLHGASRLRYVTLTRHHRYQHSVSCGHCNRSSSVTEARGVNHHNLRFLGNAVNEMGKARLVCLVVACEGRSLIETARPTREPTGWVSIQGRHIDAVGRQATNEEFGQGCLTGATLRAGYCDDRHAAPSTRLYV